MPNGLTFTKLLKPVIFALRRQIQQIMGYLGGSFLMGDIFNKCKEEVLPNVGLFSKLIFLIHLRFCPARKLNFWVYDQFKKNDHLSLWDQRRGNFKSFHGSKNSLYFKNKGPGKNNRKCKAALPCVQYGRLYFSFSPQVKNEALKKAKKNLKLFVISVKIHYWWYNGGNRRDISSYLWRNLGSFSLMAKLT